METKKILIGGRFVTTAEKFEVVAPYTGRSISAISSANESEAFEAVEAAEDAAAKMRAEPRYRLREGLERISLGIRNRKNEFARCIAEESGKPIIYAGIEVERAIETFRIAAAEAERLVGEVVPVDMNADACGRTAITTQVPRGVIFGITPFNYPLNLVAHKVAPALASGNAVLIKPSEKTPLTSLILGEIFLKSGLPVSALQVVPMALGVLAEVLNDDRVKMISFTGSDKVGWMLKSRYPKKAIALELGGNAPVIVDSSADLEDAAKRITAGAFAYSGQVCISVQRILVENGIENELTEAVAERAMSLTIGDPLDNVTKISSMISKQAAMNAIESVLEAVDHGAEIVCGGKREEAIVHPTLLRKVDPELRVVTDEIFAPVATIEPFGYFAEAIEMANQSRFGLQAGVFTNNMKHAQYASRELEYGGVIINDVPTFRVDNMPYGGIKESGIGREGVRYAMQEMCEQKLIVTRT